MADTKNFAAQLRDVPSKPGVYLFRDRLGKVIYVGKAARLRTRLRSYFQPSRSQRWDRKFKALVDSIESFEFHVVHNEPEALLLEGKAFWLLSVALPDTVTAPPSRLPTTERFVPDTSVALLNTLVPLSVTGLGAMVSGAAVETLPA